MSDLFAKAIVEKRNVLNELRSNNLTLQELRFFSIYLSKINPYDINTRTVKFKLSDFQKIMNFKTLNIVQLKSATDSLLTKLVHIPKESGGFKTFQLFKECEVDKDSNGEWYVSIDAHDNALPLMFDFKDKYFKYELWNSLRLKSANQIRMYEILKQYENLGKREISVKELRELLGIATNEYPRWDRFRDRVIDSCQHALKEITDICFEYKRGRTGQGGKWITIIFNISKNKDYKDQLLLDEFISKNNDDVEEVGELNNRETLYEAPKFIEFDELDELEEEKEKYQDERLGFFAIACDEEFSEIEMERIFKMIIKKQLPEHQMGIDFAREEYLSKMYSKFKVYAEKKQIQKERRYSYFCRMIENDIMEETYE